MNDEQKLKVGDIFHWYFAMAESYGYFRVVDVRFHSRKHMGFKYEYDCVQLDLPDRATVPFFNSDLIKQGRFKLVTEEEYLLEIITA